MRRKDKKKFYTTVLIVLLLLIGVGYAYINTNLSIIGDAFFKRTTWDIHWISPPTVSNGSVTGANVTQAAHVTGTNNDTVEYSITLTIPRDYYEFTVTAENTGTMDGMISSISNKVYSGNTEITLPDYVKSEISYSSGARVKEKQLLRSNTSETFKVRISYRDDIEVNQLPGADTLLSFKFNVTYVKADNTAIEILHPSSFGTDDWPTIKANVDSGVYKVGDTRELDMGTLGTHTLRVANTTTPAECSTTGFSQTACGFVIEFDDIISMHYMNSEYTNVGGWPASDMRTYLNNDIYNALPTALKNAICDTTVVSGHGNNDSENFTTTDKLYLLSYREIWKKAGTSTIDTADTAWNQSRQLDYYEELDVTTDYPNYAEAIKQYNGTNDYWWLRSASSNRNAKFGRVNNSGDWDGGDGNVDRGVSPAFRIE